MHIQYPTLFDPRWPRYSNNGVRQRVPAELPMVPESRIPIHVAATLVFQLQVVLVVGKCAQNCATGAIKVEAGCARTDRNRCISCFSCVGQCPESAREIAGQETTLEAIMKKVLSGQIIFRCFRGRCYGQRWRAVDASGFCCQPAPQLSTGRDPIQPSRHQDLLPGRSRHRYLAIVTWCSWT